MNKQGLFLLFATSASVLGCADLPNADVDEPHASATQGWVRMSEGAARGIGLTVEAVGHQEVEYALDATGWLMVEPGRESVVRAPVTGMLLPAAEGGELTLGSAVSNATELAQIEVFVSPQEQAQLVAAKEEADILIRQSQVSLELAEEQLARVRELPAGSITATRLVELEETAARARVAAREAGEILPFLPDEPYDAPVRLDPVSLAAPLTGRVTQLHARPGQIVAQGDALLTVSDWSLLWVRVPVFEGDLQQVVQAAAAQVRAANLQEPISATPVQAPQATEAGRRAVDLVYAVENPSGVLRPGQPVNIRLPTGRPVERVVVPRSAILWDGAGNTWVYVQADAERFRRQRIELGEEIEGRFVVESGLDGNERVVTVGAEALYGEEFRGQLQAEDDD